MNKKLLALAVAAAALPLSAQADVTIYGQVHSSIDVIDADAASDTYTDVTSRSSRIGFKGSEDLGDGLSFIWQAETTYDMSNGGAWGSGRNAFVGLAGGWGTFVYGNHDTPLKMSTAKLDFFADELADNDNGGSLGFVDIRAADAIAYISPNMSGLTLAGAIIPDGDYDGDGDVAGAYSLAAMYSNGGLYLAGAYENLDDLIGGADRNHWRVGAGFDFDAFGVAAIYEDGEGFYGDYDIWQISGKFTFGNNVVKAMYGQNDTDTRGDNDAWAIGLDHNFTKRTKVYAQYADSEFNLKDTNYGGDQSGFSVGLKHKF